MYVRLTESPCLLVIIIITVGIRNRLQVRFAVSLDDVDEN